ncbi:hypothetical protein [Gallaecimonas mangrovi]|uniref:hypothetical protein n=1 Tax=Gallaecimonas mangrovi TaxID=2291597 RepID=UPI000E20020C|nr:hypothetical protein [Gallaecimonas mangrovi]
MRRFLAFAVVTLLSACSQTLPEVNAQKLTNDFNQLKSQPLTPAPALNKAEYLQAENHKQPCRVVVTGLSAKVNHAKWFGQCKKGYASGLGVTELVIGQYHSYDLEAYSAPGKSITYWHYDTEHHLLFVGREAPLYRSGRQMELSLDANGFYSLYDGYLFVDKEKNAVYEGQVNALLGTQRLLHRYANGTTFVGEVSHDTTLNTAMGFMVLAGGKPVFLAQKLRNGSVVAMENGQAKDAHAIVPYITKEAQQAEQYLPISENDFAEGFAQYQLASAKLCKSHERELAEFCATNPYAAFSDEFRKTAQFVAKARLERQAQIRQQQMVAQIQQQQQYQAWSNAMNNLNQVSQNMALKAQQSVSKMSLPNPVIQRPNSVNIYTCQNVSNWTYCRQQR